MLPKRNVNILCTLIIMGIQLISTGYCAAVNGEGDSGKNARKARSIAYFHDSLTHQEQSQTETDNGQPSPKPKLRRRSLPKMKLIPADDMLRHEFYPEKVEQELGQVRIQRRSSRDLNDDAPVEMNSAMSNEEENAESANEEKVHDLEEIFQILARRDGQLLEQMESLKTAIDRLYGIFEFMGIARLPQAQRDEAVRKVLERSFNVESERRARVKRT